MPTINKFGMSRKREDTGYHDMMLMVNQKIASSFSELDKKYLDQNEADKNI